MALRAPVQEIRIRNADYPNLGRGLMQDDEAGRIVIRQRAQQDAVNDRKYRRVRTDAEREGEQGNGGEGWGLAQHAQPVANILEQSFHHVYSSGLPALFLHLIESAEIDAGAA